PVGKKFELAPPQAPLRERGAPDADADARRLPGDPGFLWDRFGRSDDAAPDETRSAFVLAREDEDGIAFGDVLTAIHRLLRAKRERLCRRIANLGLDRERHIAHLVRLILRSSPACHITKGSWANPHWDPTVRTPLSECSGS